ncbi:hypothetical protein M885DRAFT_565386 [Pelagophyceae sp. CCMP2097]|nr:hypothetical protein M885DRAFT_565386 [Pelagophyceae sp. CCMP2097]
MALSGDFALVAAAAEFCLAEGMLADWARFMDEHDATFRSEEAKQCSEHALEHTAVHRAFLDTVEAQLSDWLATRGSSVDAFQRTCAALAQDAGDDGDGDSERVFVQTFLQLMTMALDYEPFADIMRSRARRQYFFGILGNWRTALRSSKK